MYWIYHETDVSELSRRYELLKTQPMVYCKRTGVILWTGCEAEFIIWVNPTLLIGSRLFDDQPVTFFCLKYLSR